MMRLRLLAGCILSLLLPSGLAASTASPPSQPPPPEVAVHVTIETIAVDRRGTWSAGTDEADIFPGGSGVLSRTATLMGREARHPSREMVEITARIAPQLTPDGTCTLQLRTEARGVVAGARAGKSVPPGELKNVSLPLKMDEEKLVEVYASTITQGRLALKVRCGTPELGTASSDPEFVDFVLSIERAEGDGQPEILKSNRLRAAVGREASDLFSFNVTLPEDDGGKRYRRERLDIGLMPQLISGERLQLEVGVRCELATVSAGAATVTHPVERRETAVVMAGEMHTLDLEVHSSGDREGWDRVRYTIRVLSRF